MRLFLGIALADAVVEELSKMSMRLRRKDDGLRWSAPESWHITLQFLGNVGPEQYDCVVARMREVRSLPVPVRIEAIGFFDRVGVFFAGVRPARELLALQQRVTAATGLCGFAAEERPYHPHITLARSKGRDGGRGLRELKTRVQREPKFSGFLAEEVLLYESVSEAGGVRYEVREWFGLGGSGDAV